MDAPDTQPVTTAPVPPPPDTSNLADTRTPVQQPQPQVAAPPPQKHGLAAILAAVGDALGGGATRGQVNPQTGAVEQVNRSTGAKIGSAVTTLIRGAAAGAAQHGPGSIGRSGMAGEQSQEDFQQQQQKRLKEQTQNVLETQQNQRANQENERQNQLTQASLAMHNQQMARMSLDREREGLQFSKEQADVANQMQAIQSIPGAKLLGHFASNDQMNKYLENISPEQSQQHAADFAKNLIQAVPNPKGGFDAYQVPKGWQDQPIGEGKTLSTFTTEVGKDGKVKPVWKSIPAPPDMKMSDYMTWQGQTLKASNDQESHEANLKKEGAQTQEALAGTAEKNVETKLKKEQLQEMGDQSLSGQDYLNSLKGPYRSLVEEMGTGKMPMQRMEYLIARKPEVAAAVAKAFPDFDGSKVTSYVSTYKDYTSGPVSKQLNAGGTALQHLKELHDLNTSASHIPGTQAYIMYKNKVDTVATELARFYGDTTIPAIAAIKKTLDSTLPGNRNAAIRTQAKSMGDKLDSYEQQWKNAAPSKAYEAPMPGISEKAKLARAALDPDYGHSLTTPGMHEAAGGVHLSNFHVNPQTGERIGWNGQAWVPAPQGAQ